MINTTSNIDLTNHSGKKVIFHEDQDFKKGKMDIKNILIKGKIKKYDAFLFFNPSSKEIILSAIITTLYRRRSYLYDANLKKPLNVVEKIIGYIKGFLINKSSALIVMHKNVDAYKKYYRIKDEKILYVPFKSNCYEIRDSIISEDHGYILSCGASHRDYSCFIEAIRDVSIPVKIVLPNKEKLFTHKTEFQEKNLPENVTVVRHNFSKESWYEILRKAKIVVIPIDKNCIQPAGISVYLEAMSLGKPTVISRGPSTDQIIANEALLVDRGDHQQLQAAIQKLINDEHLLKKISAAGKKYADSLEGVDRLMSDLRNVIVSGQ